MPFHSSMTINADNTWTKAGSTGYSGKCPEKPTKWDGKQYRLIALSGATISIFPCAASDISFLSLFMVFKKMDLLKHEYRLARSLQGFPTQLCNLLFRDRVPDQVCDSNCRIIRTIEVRYPNNRYLLPQFPLSMPVTPEESKSANRKQSYRT